MKYAVAQLGARRSYAIPRILESAGMLELFFTDMYAGVGLSALALSSLRLIRSDAIKRLSGRVARDLPSDKVVAHPFFGLEYHRRLRAGHGQRAYVWSARGLGRRVLRHGFGEANAVYTLNGAGLEILEGAKRLGLRTVSEQTIAPLRVERRLLGEERERFPGWEAALVDDRAADVMQLREEREWAFADTILCGSDFVRAGIEECGGPGSRCVVVPYGIDASYSLARPSFDKRADKNRPLRVLTVGAVSLRKGSPYVLEAAKLLGREAELRMIGTLRVSPSAQQALQKHVTLFGAVPRSEVVEHYKWADVFLLPSICEGSAESSYEALAAGLPVIATPNAGTIARDEEEGFIVPAGDAAAVAECLSRLASDRVLLEQMSLKALARAVDTSFDAYAKRLLPVLNGEGAASIVSRTSTSR